MVVSRKFTSLVTVVVVVVVVAAAVVVVVVVVVVAVVVVSFMQDIYIYIPDTNHVHREYSVAAIL